MEGALTSPVDAEAAEAVERELVEKYKLYCLPSLARLMKFSGYGHVEWKASGSVVTTVDGKDYIDCGGGYGVFSLGHRHPKVVAAVKEQLELMPMSPRVFFCRPQIELAELLAKVTPGALRHTFFCNSGAEAVEGALKLARLATGRTEIVAAEGAFHGKTMGALSVSGRQVYKDGFEPLIPDIVHVPYGDSAALEAAVSDRTAAVILEPIQGEAGIVVPPEGYLEAARAACDRHGALLIIDEIQTGLGRTGEMFACEHDGVQPDMMTLAKGLGGGVLPLGAFTGTPEVWQAFAANPLVHTSTFGGNPLACAAGKAAIEATVEEGLPERAARMGEYLMARLEALKARHPDYISEVRGRGLMVGVELTNEGIGGVVIPSMAGAGVTAIYTLNNPRVIRFEPPLIITQEELDRVVEVFGKAIEEVATKYAHLFKTDTTGTP